MPLDSTCTPCLSVSISVDGDAHLVDVFLP